LKSWKVQSSGSKFKVPGSRFKIKKFQIKAITPPSGAVGSWKVKNSTPTHRGRIQNSKLKSSRLKLLLPLRGLGGVGMFEKTRIAQITAHFFRLVFLKEMIKATKSDTV